MNPSKRGMFALTCLLSISSAYAEWTKIGENQYGRFYVDEATLMSKGDVRSFQMLDDMNAPNKEGDRSIVAMYEVDCASRKSRSAKTTYFSLAMGKGTSLTLEPEMNAGSPATPKVVWQDSAVGQPSEKIINWACKSK